MRGVVDLDDGSLLYIFSKVGDARKVARLSAVCKRWRELRWSVSNLSFSFAAATQEELRMSEDVISSVLCCTKNKAPGNLKHLLVTLSCVPEAEAACHWLVWVTGLEELQVRSNGSLTWGPTLWNSVVSMDTIKNFAVFGKFHSFLPPHVAKGLTLKNLRQCSLARGRVPASLLHAMLAACSALIHLSVSFFQDASIRVASGSLRTLELLGAQPFEVIIDAPKLTFLRLHSVGIGTETAKPSIQFVSQGLRELRLRVPCVLNNRCDSLRKLTFIGLWEMEQPEEVANVLKLTPMISELHLRFQLSRMHKINIDNVIAPLTSLRSIHFDSSVTTVESRTSQRWMFICGQMEPYDVRLLRHLLEVHKIRSLSVHCKDLIDHRTKKVKQSYSRCRDLFEVLLFHPDRVKLCPT